jgi:hypothetical protein
LPESCVAASVHLVSKAFGFGQTNGSTRASSGLLSDSGQAAGPGEPDSRIANARVVSAWGLQTLRDALMFPQRPGLRRRPVTDGAEGW